MSNFRFPTLHSAGFFDSREVFANMQETPKRVVLRYELEFFTESGGMLFLDEHRHEIKADMVLVARPGQTRSSRLPFSAYFVKLEAPEGDLAMMLDRLNPYGSTLRMEEYLRLVREIAAYYSSAKCADRLHAYARLFELISILYEEQKHSTDEMGYATSRHRSAVRGAIDYIERHYREKCTLEEIAAAVNFSPIYFNRLFLSMTGETPYAYMNRRRMEEARTLLVTTDALLFEISEMCGFSSPSYFASSFHKNYGVTPRVYRETERKKYLEN